MNKNLVKNKSGIDSKSSSIIIICVILAFIPIMSFSQSTSTLPIKPDSTLKPANTKLNQFYIGIRGGATYSILTGGTNGFEDYQYQPGFNAGVSCALQLKSHFMVETDLDYYQNGLLQSLKINITTIETPHSNSYVGFKDHFRNNYLNNTWLLGYSYGKSFVVSAQLGGYAALYLNTNEKSILYKDIDPADTGLLVDPIFQPGYYEEIKHSTYYASSYPKFDFGLVGGILFAYKIKEIYQISFSSRYYVGLVDLTHHLNTSEGAHYNRSFNVAIGISYVF